MAADTPLTVRNLTCYQVFVRQHSEAGNFAGVLADLDRIAALNVDILYLMPIHPLGQLNRKGDVGSPYAIADYREIDPAYGTKDEFQTLILEAHRRGLRVMMDIVLNHTAPDHVYVKTHPEWYYHKADGSLGNRVGNWTDIIDFDYASPELWTELKDMLKGWALMGADGFRCDVASLVPLNFWKQIRAEIRKLNPDFLWLAESSHKEFISNLRQAGFNACSDGELMQAFDVNYDYEFDHEFREVLERKRPLSDWMNIMKLQEVIYPLNYCKLRSLENHDTQRLFSVVTDRDEVRNWTAASFFEKGMAFVYAGQEAWNTAAPSLFTRDPIDWSTLDEDYCSLIRSLIQIKHHPLITEAVEYHIHQLHPEALVMEYRHGERRLIGVFNVRSGQGEIDLSCKAETVINLIDGLPVTLHEGRLKLSPRPVIFEI